MNVEYRTLKAKARLMRAGLAGACLALLPASALAQEDGFWAAPDEVAPYATSMEKDLASLSGDWQGQGSSGTKVTIHFAAARGTVPLTGKLKVDGGAFAGETDLSLLHTGSFYYLVPAASPFVPAGPEAKSPYTLMRVAGGGFRFVRLVHLQVSNQAAVQSEELLLGKRHADGSRTLKFMSGERLCVDPASPAGKVCGEGSTDQITLHKANA